MKAEKDYYFDCDIKGRVAVVVRARNKKEALDLFKEGIWHDRYDVSIEPDLPPRTKFVPESQS